MTHPATLETLRPAETLLKSQKPGPRGPTQARSGTSRAGRARIPVGTVYGMEDIVRAHQDMEAGRVGGKGVVLTSPAAP